MSKNKEYLIKRGNSEYEVIIGLEVHAQVLSKSKLFSDSPTNFGAEPNTQVSLVDAAFPGMLPVINEFCIKQAVKTGIGLNAAINKKSIFDRKNYFYADLPQGYQISQYKDPIVGEGSILLDLPDGEKKVGIERLHLEQDAGKSIHEYFFLHLALNAAFQYQLFFLHLVNLIKLNLHQLLDLCIEKFDILVVNQHKNSFSYQKLIFYLSLH